MLLFYIPCPDKDCAENISRTLLMEKLVACANIIPGMQSIYWWQGNIETSSEHILLLKTLKTPDAQERIAKRVSELHPYDVPCVMTLPVLGINESYKKWLEESLK
ncbi:MAG: divalent-cation tolerance protein CutA [Pseudobdellovibrionaceae bacterium]